MNFGGGSLDSKSEILEPFLRVKVIGQQLPSHVVFSPNAPYRNFKIAICSENSPKIAKQGLFV